MRIKWRPSRKLLLQLNRTLKSVSITGETRNKQYSNIISIHIRSEVTSLTVWFESVSLFSLSIWKMRGELWVQVKWREVWHFSLDSLSSQTRLNWLLRLKRSRNLILMCVSLPAWFSSWWGWSQSSSTPNAAPPHGQRWHARCHKPRPAGCRLQTRPRWTRCLYWASPTHRTTGGEGGRERENNIVNGYRYLSTVLNNYLGGHLRNQKQWEV